MAAEESAEKLTQELEETKPSRYKRVLSFIFKNYLPLSLVFLVLFGMFVPQPGAFLSKGPTHYICIVGLFFHSGIKLKTGEVKKALKSLKALLFGIVSILFITTTIGVSLTGLLPFDEEEDSNVAIHANGFANTTNNFNGSSELNITRPPTQQATRNGIFGPQAFRIGMQIYFIVPCTIAAGVVMVAQAGGNSTLALMLTVICNMISVFTAPPMISWLMKFKGVKLDFVQLLIKLVLTVLLPLLVGKAFRYIPRVKPFVKKYSNTLKIISVTLLVMIPWMKVSQSSAAGSFSNVPVSSMFACIAWALTIHILYGIINLTASLLLRLDKPALKAIVVLASQKSLTVAVTVLAFLPFSASQQGLVALPIVLIHLVVLVLDSIIVARWYIWDQRKKEHVLKDNQCNGDAPQCNGALLVDQGDAGAVDAAESEQTKLNYESAV